MKRLGLLSRLGNVFGLAEVGPVSAWTKRCCRCLSTVSSNVNTVNDNHTEENYKRIMRKVPQCVLVVTAAEYDILKDCWIKRGMTCTSFTNVSYQPPIVSICINNPSHMHELLLRTQKFAIHVLKQNQNESTGYKFINGLVIETQAKVEFFCAERSEGNCDNDAGDTAISHDSADDTQQSMDGKQVQYGLNFSKHVEAEECQFVKIPHEQTNEGVPIISGCAAVMECRAHSVHTVGDHHVWYGSVVNARTNETKDNPLLYYIRSFRSVGDEIFIQAFEDATLPYEDWTHEAHLRMAWNYITEHGREGAIPHIRHGIQRFNEQNKDKVKFGFHETITMFYIAEVAYAIKQSHGVTSFETFLDRNHYLLDKTVISQYYSHSHLYSDTARHQFVQPDLKPLPN